MGSLKWALNLEEPKFRILCAKKILVFRENTVDTILNELRMNDSRMILTTRGGKHAPSLYSPENREGDLSDFLIVCNIEGCACTLEGKCYKTSCGHLFCEPCAYKSFSNDTVCPICRAVLCDGEVVEILLGVKTGSVARHLYQSIFETNKFVDVINNVQKVLHTTTEVAVWIQRQLLFHSNQSNKKLIHMAQEAEHHRSNSIRVAMDLKSQSLSAEHLICELQQQVSVAEKQLADLSDAYKEKSNKCQAWEKAYESLRANSPHQTAKYMPVERDNALFINSGASSNPTSIFPVKRTETTTYSQTVLASNSAGNTSKLPLSYTRRDVEYIPANQPHLPSRQQPFDSINNQQQAFHEDETSFNLEEALLPAQNRGGKVTGNNIQGTAQSALYSLGRRAESYSSEHKLLSQNKSSFFNTRGGGGGGSGGGHAGNRVYNETNVPYRQQTLNKF